MRRWLALAAATLIASTLTAAPVAAQAAAPDPAQAVKRQLRAERGVQIAEISRTAYNETSWFRFRYSSRLQLGPAGPVATDISLQIVLDPKARQQLEDRGELADVEGPIGATVVGGYTYISGLYSLPQGKTWAREELPKGPAIKFVKRIASQQTIDVFDPATLKTMLKGVAAKPVSGGGFFYRGTLVKQKIAWRLWTDAAGLPTRLMTSRNNLSKISVERIDTRYSDWGMPLVVFPPPADEVIDYKDLDDPFGFSVPDPKELINTLRR